MKNYKGVFEGKTILITGGLGFIGSNLAVRLAEFNPKKIIIVDSLIPGLGGDIHNIKELINSNVLRFVQEDIRTIPTMKPLILESDIIFNLAGSIKHTHLDEKELAFDTETNFLSQVFFLEAIRQAMTENPSKKIKVIFSGTRDQYGKVPYEDLPVRENYLQKNLTDYQSISKNSAESHHMIVNNILREEGIDIKINSLRLTNTYGPKQSARTGAAIPIFIEKSTKGETIELWGGGEFLRDINYVDDVVNAFFLIASSEFHGEVYNLGCCVGKMDMQRKGIGGNLSSIKEIAEKIVSISGKGEIKVIPYPKERKSVEPGFFAADISKISQLGWFPKTTLDEGLKKTLEWKKNNF